MAGHHVESTRHEGTEAALLRELGEAKRQRDAALAERDRYLAVAQAAVRQGEATANRLRHERDRLRDAARAFLAVLDRTNFSAVALRGPALDELRRLCK